MFFGFSFQTIELKLRTATLLYNQNMIKNFWFLFWQDHSVGFSPLFQLHEKVLNKSFASKLYHRIFDGGIQSSISLRPNRPHFLSDEFR